MSDDRFLIIKNSVEKWSVIQEFCNDYRMFFQRVLLIQNLGDDVVGLHLEFDKDDYEKFIKYIYKERGSIYYPEKLEWIPVTEDEWTDGIPQHLQNLTVAGFRPTRGRVRE